MAVKIFSFVSVSSHVRPSREIAKTSRETLHAGRGTGSEMHRLEATNLHLCVGINGLREWRCEIPDPS